MSSNTERKTYILDVQMKLNEDIQRAVDQLNRMDAQARSAKKALEEASKSFKLAGGSEEALKQLTSGLTSLGQAAQGAVNPMDAWGKALHDSVAEAELLAPKLKLVETNLAGLASAGQQGTVQYQVMSREAANLRAQLERLKGAGVGAKALGAEAEIAAQQFKSWNQSLLANVAIASQLPARIKQVETELVRLSAAGQQGSGAFQAYSAELHRLQNEQAALQRSAAGTAAGFGTLRGQVQNASFQITDFVVSVQNGTKASVALGQQLPQLLGAFGAFGAAAGLVIALGAALAGPFLNSLLSAGDAAEEFNKGIGKVGDAIDLATQASKEANFDDLIKEFNRLSGTAREARLELLGVARAMAEGELNKAQKAFEETVNGLGKGIGAAILGQRSLADQASRVGEQLGISASKAEDFIAAVKQGTAEGVLSQFGQDLAQGSDKARALVADLVKISKATRDVSDQRAQLLEIENRLSAGGASGVVKTTKELEDARKKQEDLIKRAADETKRQEEALAALRVEYVNLIAPLSKVDEFLLKESLGLVKLTGARREATLELLRGIDTYKQYADRVREGDKAIEEQLQREERLREANRRRNEEQQRFIDSYDKEGAAARKFAADLARIDELFFNGFVSGEQYERMLANITGQTKAATKATNEAEKALEKISDQITASVASSFNKLIESIGTAKFSFSDFARAFVFDMVKIINQILIFTPLAEAMKKVIKEMSDAFDKAGGFSGILGSLGNIFSGGIGSLPYSAGGGFIGGVSGPAVAPMVSAFSTARLADASRSLVSGSTAGRYGTSLNVTVNNTVPGVEVETRQTDEGLTIDIVRRALVQDIRRGGNAVASALQGVYGLNRAAAR